MYYVKKEFSISSSKKRNCTKEFKIEHGAAAWDQRLVNLSMTPSEIFCITKENILWINRLQSYAKYDIISLQKTRVQFLAPSPALAAAVAKIIVLYSVKTKEGWNG